MINSLAVAMNRARFWENDSTHLNPSSLLSRGGSTCFNRIDLPDYDKKEELLEKLKAAVTLSSVGFDIE